MHWDQFERETLLTLLEVNGLTRLSYHRYISARKNNISLVFSIKASRRSRSKLMMADLNSTPHSSIQKFQKGEQLR